MPASTPKGGIYRRDNSLLFIVGCLLISFDSQNAGTEFVWAQLEITVLTFGTFCLSSPPPAPPPPAKEVKLSERKIFVILQMALELPLEILTGLLMPDFTFLKK